MEAQAMEASSVMLNGKSVRRISLNGGVLWEGGKEYAFFYKEYSSVTGQYELTPIKSITAGDVITLKEGSDIAAANSGTDMYNPDLVFEEWSCPLEITDGTITIPEDFYGDLIIVASYHTQDGLDHYIDNSGNDTTTNPGSSVLKRVYFSNSVTTIGRSAFYKCTRLTSAVIGNSVTTIGNYAFCECRDLTSITLSNSVTTIGEFAFYNCTSLPSITLPNSLTTIGNYTFYYCTSLPSITLPNSLTTIGNYTFYYCTSLTSITIPNSLTTIGYGAFFGCSNLKTFTGKFASDDNRCLIVDGVLKSFAPAELTTYTLPNSVTTIGREAFYNCKSLTSITLPNSLTTIGKSAFQECYTLPSINIPNSVTAIGNAAFKGCGAMREYIFNSTTPPTLSSTDVFTNIPSDCKIYVPNESVDAYKQATNWSEYATYIIPISQRTQS